MHVEVTRLRYFLAVADHAHFRRAAESLHLTPPPLSKQIRLLEAQLGGPLFERGYHQVRLTPLGEALVEPARDIVERVDALPDLLARLTGTVRPLRVGATAFAPSDFLDRVAAALASLGSAEPLQISGSALDVAASVRAGSLDLGVVHLAAGDGLESLLLATYDNALAVRADDPLAADHESGGPVTADEIRGRRIMVDYARPNPDILDWVTRRLTRLGAHPALAHDRATTRISEVELAGHARLAGHPVLISHSPGSMLARIFAEPEFRIRTLDPAVVPPGRLGIVWPQGSGEHSERGERLGAAARALADAYRAAVEAAPSRTGTMEG